MTRYYCDYCDTYLTHDSPSVRKQHNSGYKHKANVRQYYQQFEELQTQSLIDQRIKEHLGQAAVAAYQQVGAPFNQHMLAVPGLVQRPRLPVPLPPPGLPIGVSPQAPLMPGMRPPFMMPPPIGVNPGYGTASFPTVPNVAMPPGAPPTQFSMNNIARPPSLEPPVSGALPTASSNGSAPFTNPIMYQTNQMAAPSVSSAPTSESNH